MDADTARRQRDTVITAFYQGDARLLECYPVRPGDRESCFLWSYFATTGMLYQALAAGSGQQGLYRELIEGLRHYRAADSTEEIARYHSERGEEFGHGPVFFDDNIWVARNLLWAHEVFGDARYLDEARRVTAFVYTAWSDELGGVVWNEAGLAADGTIEELERGLSANACGILVSAQLHRLTGEASYLDWATRFHEFCSTMLDPVTGIYFNGVHTELVDGERRSGAVNRDLYSYNSGSMILANLALFDITGQQFYVDDAVRTAHAAHDAFLLRDAASGKRARRDFVWFLAVLGEGYLALLERGLIAHGMFAEFEGSLAGAQRFASAAGLLPHDHEEGWRQGDDAEYDRMLLTHAGTAEIAQLLLLAERVPARG